MSTIWVRDATDGILVLLDLRMAFPSPEAAAAYLDAAELVLSERDGYDLELDPNADAIGEHHRRFGGETTVGDAVLAFHAHLVHVGPIAAKVFLMTGPDVRSEADALVRTAAQRMAAGTLPRSGEGSTSPSPSLVVASPGPTS